MLGSSRTSFAEVREALVSRAGESGFDAVAGELLAVSTVLASSSALRGGLADSGRDAAERVALTRSVFGGKVSPLTVDILGDIVTRRWSQARDLVDAVEGVGVEAVLIGAERAGRADMVEDELFRIDRLIAGDPGLRRALTDPSAPDSARADLIGGLLDGKVADESAVLVRHVVANPRGRRLERALAELVEASAQRRERLLATVRVAAGITQDQQDRLAAALTAVYRRAVDVQVEVDPAVRGGVVVAVGDEVIDGSVAHRLDQIRRLMGVN